jgi:7-cyano-7-deazaguanine synthase in queuosine biosynthesis
MAKGQSLSKIKDLRKKYPKFIYEGYSYKLFKKDLKIFFDFKIPPDIEFKPEITIKNINKKRFILINPEIINNFIFHLGLIETLGYWKAACSPKIEIKAGYLNKEQIKWWKDLIIKGMGEYFYSNKIDFRKENFIEIKTRENCKNKKINLYARKLKSRILIPIGGGKDSIVTLEIFRKNKKNINCLRLNPTARAKHLKSAKRIMEINNCSNPIIARRKIDKKLLELNQKGFLNGHTPFSAYLAFLNVIAAVLFDYKYIAFSNERSSNEGNVKYLGKIINHQWSKSFEFEKKFRDYSKKYLTKETEYFSFLRSLYEIQIAKIFSNFPKYFPIFLSCNEAYKTYSGTKKITGKWCGKCPKCLFVWIALYPFLGEKKLIKIFSENLFEKKELLPIMKGLIGEKKNKPFECVGTKKECLIAFYLGLEKFKSESAKNTKPLFLLNYFEKNILPKYPNLKSDSKKILNSWNKQNNLPKNFEKILKKTAAPYSSGRI